MINFNILHEYERPVAIRCREEWQAEELLKELRIQYPHLTEGWRFGQNYWEWYEGETCYAPHINDDLADHIQFSPVQYWSSHGFEVIPYEQLVGCIDMGELEVCGSIEHDLLGIL